MYVGAKDPSAEDVLGRNGLRGGDLYVLELDGHASEADFRVGTERGEWVRLPGAEAMDETELDAASESAGAFGFVRIEDAAPNPKNQKELFFNTTGGTPEINELGRVYRLEMNPGNASQPVRLTVLENADLTVSAGGDTGLSPDNIDTEVSRAHAR